MKLQKSPSLFVFALALCLLVANCAHAAPFKIVGYFLLGGDASKIEYAALTHIDIAFANLSANGELSPLASDDERQMNAIIASAKSHGVKVLISVGGEDSGKVFARATATPEKIQRLVDDLTQFVANHQLDGIDLDWEYPDTQKSSQACIALLKRLGKRLHARGKLLTSAVAPGKWIVANYQLAQIAPLVDWINIMAYDNDESRIGHSTFDDAKAALATCESLEMPREKCLLGVPFYGRKRADFSQEKPFADLVRLGADPHDDLFDDWFYNGTETIRKKVALAKSEGGGVAIWELSEDLPSDDSNALQKIIFAASR